MLLSPNMFKMPWTYFGHHYCHNRKPMEVSGRQEEIAKWVEIMKPSEEEESCVVRNTDQSPLAFNTSPHPVSCHPDLQAVVICSFAGKLSRLVSSMASASVQTWEW